MISYGVQMLMVCRCPHLHLAAPVKTISYAKEDLCIPYNYTKRHYLKPYLMQRGTFAYHYLHTIIILLLFLKPFQTTLYKLYINPKNPELHI
jgi:hypothetical protein